MSKKITVLSKKIDLINFDHKFYHINNQFSWLFPECSLRYHKVESNRESFAGNVVILNRLPGIFLQLLWLGILHSKYAL